MSIEILLTLAGVVLLVLLSAYLTAGETALSACTRTRMHTLEQDGDRRASLVNRLLRRPERMIGGLAIARTLVDSLVVVVAAALGFALAGEVGALAAVGLMVVALVVFAHVLAKTWGGAYADRIALAVAPIVRVVVAAFGPLTAAVHWVVRMVLKLTPSRTDDDANILAAHEDLRGTIELSHMEGSVGRGDAAMLGGVLDLGELQVLDIMVHRTKMETIDADAGPEAIVDAVLKSQYSRVPLWRQQPENIVGVLHSKDLLTAIERAGWDVTRLDVAPIVKPPWFVPETTAVKDQLNHFLKRKAQMALVVDEYGEVKGLITLEDILEEIVGQIADEHDVGEVAVRLQADGTVNVDGTVPVRDLNRQMDWDLPVEEATTIAGLVIHEAQTIPEPGQAFTFHGYRFEILRKSRNKITAVRIKPVEPRSGRSETAKATRSAAAGETDPMASG
jgi:Mg2+/Co2+ transporter CorB